MSTYPPNPIYEAATFTCPICGYITLTGVASPCDLCGNDECGGGGDVSNYPIGKLSPQDIIEIKHEQEEARQWIADLNHMGDYVQNKIGFWYRKDPKWISLSDFLQQRSGGQKKNSEEKQPQNRCVSLNERNKTVAREMVDNPGPDVWVFKRVWGERKDYLYFNKQNSDFAVISAPEGAEYSGALRTFHKKTKLGDKPASAQEIWAWLEYTCRRIKNGTD